MTCTNSPTLPRAFPATAALIAALAALLAACGARGDYVPGTTIDRTPRNERVIKRIEEYRLALERKDAGQLLLMAAPDYWEESGTPTGSDDYGYDGLRDVLAKRLQHASLIRYSLRYMSIAYKADRAYVDVIIDASFTIRDAQGQERRLDKRDQNQLVLRRNDKSGEWMFVSGM